MKIICALHVINILKLCINTVHTHANNMLQTPCAEPHRTLSHTPFCLLPPVNSPLFGPNTTEAPKRGEILGLEGLVSFASFFSSAMDPNPECRPSGVGFRVII